MNQRNLAGLLAAPLLVGLWVVALTQPLPYVTYQPGLTLDVLGEADGKEIIQVDGAETFRDGGELRMTTVSASQPKPTTVNLFELMEAWISPDDAVYPYDVVYSREETRETNEKQGQEEMVSSQHLAAAVALTELGYKVTEARIAEVLPDTPAVGKLETDDVVLKVNGTPVQNELQLAEAIGKTPAGDDVELVIRRGNERRTVTITPEVRDGVPYVGIAPTTAVLQLPFDVRVQVADIGGPSAGLMFSLGIYDTLTPGPLTGGAVVAGTGEIDGAGRVGSIGGIQQKIAGAREAGADLFLVPPGNCADALGARNGDVELVRADTMHDAVSALETWADDPDAALPSCEEVAG
jgi:PDZ domain-containing protein